MSTTVLRLGLWTLVLSLTLYVIDSTFENSRLAEMITLDLVQNVFLVSIALVAAGLVLRIFEKPASKVIRAKNRCKVCNTPIAPGAIYCRPHLRGVLEAEDRRTHNTRTR